MKVINWEFLTNTEIVYSML